MNRIIGSALLLLLISASLVGQQSDRAIVDRFQGRVKQLTAFVDSAKTLPDCAEIDASVAALDSEFTAHQELLDRALYPDNFQATLTNLRGRLLVRQKDLGVIESQYVRITELETRVRELADQVTKLSADNQQLSAEITRMGVNVKALGGQSVMDQRTLDSLRSLVKRLQKNLGERDQLIFSLVDSIFMQYGKDVASLKDVDKRGVMGKIERRDVLTNLKRAITENMSFLESTGLKGNDFAELARQQKAFSNQWTALGPKLTQVYYTGRQRTNELALIDTMLTRWSAKADERLWQTLGATFKERGFALREFANGEQFSAAFSAFLDDEIANVRKEPADTRAKLYGNFESSIWKTDLKPVWLPALVETGRLTKEQGERLGSKVDDWRRTVAGTSWFAFAAIGLIIAVVGYVVVRAVFRKPKPKA